MPTMNTSTWASTPKAGRMATFLLLCCSLFSESSAFSERHLLSTRTRFSSAVVPNYLFPPVQRLKQQRRSRQEHSALSFPAGPSLDKNRSWEDMMSQASPHSEHDHVSTADKVTIAAATALAATSLIAIMTMTAPGCWRYFMAGGICAATSHTIPTPIDVVKTRKQLDPTLADRTVLKAAHEIMRNEGMGALWAGLGPTAWGYLLEGSIKFGVYEVLKPIVKSSLSRAATMTSVALLNSQILAFLLAGSASGLAASILLCPMEAIRIRMVAEPHFAPGGWVEGGYKMLKQEGVAGLFKGINPMILKQVPYTVTKNVSFDCITRFFYSTMRTQGMALTAVSTFTVPLVSAAIASVLSSISSQPGDMVLSLVNAHKGDRPSREYFQSIVRERGFRGFYVGFKTRLLHVGMIVTLQLLIYDYVKRLCGIAATGSC